jgi:hypothetical protein
MRLKLAACLVMLAALLPSVAWAQVPRLRGDAEAVAAVERMLERLGGREFWARARAVYTEFEGWRTTPNEPVMEKAWWDLREPRQRYELEGRSFLTMGGLSPRGSWTSGDDVVTRDESEAHRGKMELYPFLSFPSLHAFAVADPRFTLEWAAPNRVILRSADGQARSWWEIDQTGAPIRWGGPGGAEYVYGPVRAFGNVNYPAWGAKTDGSFRYNYTVLDVSSQAMAFSVVAPDSPEAR